MVRPNLRHARRYNGADRHTYPESVQLNVRHRRYPYTQQQNSQRTFNRARIFLPVIHRMHHDRAWYDRQFRHLIKPDRVKAQAQVQKRNRDAVNARKSQQRLSFNLFRF